MRPPAATRRTSSLRLVAFPLLLFLAIALPKLWQGDFNVDTGWYSAISLQAYRGVPTKGLVSLWTLQGSEVSGHSIPYLNKPPVAFWLNGLPLALFGPTIFAARLGSVIAAALCIAATSLIVKRFSGRAAGLAAGLILAATIPFVGLARSFSLDLWMTFFLLVVLRQLLELRDLRCLHQHRYERWKPGDASFQVANTADRAALRPILIAGAALGLALLTKPVVPLLGFTLAATWMFAPAPVPASNRRRILHLILILAIGLIIAAIWHAFMLLNFTDFARQYFGKEIADRAAANPDSAVFNKGASSPFYYLKALAETYWPWLITVLLAFAALLLNRIPTSSSPRSDRRWLWFGLAWSLVWLIALSLFADKRPRYLAPLFPVWAWMSALWLTRAAWGAPRLFRGMIRTLAHRGPIFAALAACVISLLPITVHRGPDADWRALFAWLDSHPASPIYAGGFVGQRAAKVYLHTGRWPITPGPSKPLQPGAFLLYHARDGLMPGPGEYTELQSGNLTITRLLENRWSPVRTSDPGE